MQERNATQKELAHFSSTLSAFGISLSEVADQCPKQERTLLACHKALQFAKQPPHLLEQLCATKKLPLQELAGGANVPRKTLERHRKYLIAILVAYTNGFDIIRGHLRQVAPAKGGRPS